MQICLLVCIKSADESMNCKHVYQFSFVLSSQPGKSKLSFTCHHFRPSSCLNATEVRGSNRGSNIKLFGTTLVAVQGLKLAFIR